MKTYTHLYKNRYSRESVCGCVGMAVHKRDPRVGWSWIKVEKGWRGGSVLGSKTEGENVPREIIDCIRWVSIPGADCAAQLLPRKALSASSRRVQVWVRLCNPNSPTTQPMANVCSKSRISRPAPPMIASTAGYVITVAFIMRLTSNRGAMRYDDDAAGCGLERIIAPICSFLKRLDQLIKLHIG